MPTTEISTLSLHDALPISPKLDENELHKRIRAVTRKLPWHDPLPPEKRIVIPGGRGRSEEHTSELQSRQYLVCRLLLEKKNSSPAFSFPWCCWLHQSSACA